MASLPCTRCLQVALGDPDSANPVECQYVEGVICVYCSNHYQKAGCHKIPTSLVGLAEHIQQQLARRRENKALVSAEEIQSLWRKFFAKFYTLQRENGTSSILLADGAIAEDEGFGNFEVPTASDEAISSNDSTEEASDGDDWDQGVRAPDDLYLTPENSDHESLRSSVASSSLAPSRGINGTSGALTQHQVSVNGLVDHTEETGVQKREADNHELDETRTIAGRVTKPSSEQKPSIFSRMVTAPLSLLKSLNDAINNISG